MPSTEKLDTHGKHAYPRESLDLPEVVKTISAIDVRWTETSGRVSAEQLHLKPRLVHLYTYLLASNFLVSPCIPA
jgi:hypothetical protein